MENLGTRIARLRKAKGLSQTQLGTDCNWERGQARVSNYEKGLREPNLADLRTLANALDVSLMELIEGSVTQAAEAPATYAHVPDATEYALVPQYTAHGAAGNGQLNDHVEVKGGLVFKRAWLSRMSLRERNLHVIYVQGHSMEPTVCDGDVVLLDESQTQARDGRIYALRKPDGELIIKRLIQSLTGGWIIRSDNEDKRAYPDQPVSDSDLEQLCIVGRVVWHGGAL
jgi:phage repressor protein C with HTH and peptisase S24 domain